MAYLDHLILAGLYLIAAFGITYALWIFYLAVMALKRANDAGTLTKFAKVIGLPVLWTGLILDALANIFVMSILFLEPPTEWLVTDRLSRHAQDTDGWRKSLAHWFGTHLLNPFDPDGNHLD